MTIRLAGLYAGQILDGLEVLAEDWEYTARYMATGEYDDGHIPRECSDESEARNIASLYRKIIEALEPQLR